MRGSETEWGAGFNQMVGSKFEVLYGMSREAREKVHERMRHYGLPEQVLDDYFRNYAHIDAVYLVISEKANERLSEDQLESFVDDSKQVMIDCIREYLGLS